MQITLEQILQGIRDLTETENGLIDLMTIAETLEEVIDHHSAKTEAQSTDDEDESSEGGEEGDGDETEDDTEINVTNTEEVDHLTTLQLMMLSNSITSELTDRALAAEEEDDDQDEADDITDADAEENED